jgi:ElaB/YqjD/DUF883 family membrane-anchored ribosome-binding protein
MSKSIARKISKDVEDGLDDVAHALRKAADHFSDDAEEAVAQAAKAVREASSVLATKVPATAKDLANKAVHEVKEHPLVAATAALTAAATLIGLLARSRRKAA